MRSWCAIVLAVVVMGCGGESAEPPPDDSGSASYPTSDVSGALGDLGAPVADAEPPGPAPDGAAADTSIPAGDSAGPSPGVDATFTPDATPTGDVPSPPEPTSDAETPDPTGDISPAPDQQETECLDLLACAASCEGSDPLCQQTCLAEASPAAAADAQDLRACRQDHCDGLGATNGLLCTVSACTCESETCGGCGAGCEDTGDATCSEVVSCMLDCGLMDGDLPSSIASTCCFVGCHAQGTAIAQAGLDTCVACVRDTCGGGANLIQCATGPCVSACGACTPETD